MKLLKKHKEMILKAQKLEQRKKEITNLLFEELSKKIDLTTGIGGSNSDDTNELINCFINYEEDSIELIEYSITTCEEKK